MKISLRGSTWPTPEYGQIWKDVSGFCSGEIYMVISNGNSEKRLVNLRSGSLRCSDSLFGQSKQNFEFVAEGLVIEEE